MKSISSGMELLVSVAALIFVVTLVYIILSGGTIKAEVPKGLPEKDFCKNDDDCKNDLRGERCTQIRTTGGLEKPSCGCFTDADCKGDTCVENVCSTAPTQVGTGTVT